MQWPRIFEIAGFLSGGNNEIGRNHIVHFLLQVKQNTYCKKNNTSRRNRKQWLRREHNIIRAHSIKGINSKIHSNLEYRLNNGIFSFSFTRGHDIIWKQNFTIHTSYRTVFSSYLALAKQNHTINEHKKYVRSYIF